MYGSGIDTIRSGSPMRHSCGLGNSTGGGASAGLPRGDPLSTQAAMAAISASVRDGSSLKSWIPMRRSTYHGGISRVSTLRLMERAHGRTSSYVTSDIGAIAPGRWQP